MEVFQYDAKGNIIYAGNKDMAYSFAYDANGRMTGVIDSDGKLMSYEYDNLGNRVKMTGPDGKEIVYKYDSGNRLSELLSEAGAFTFTYDSLGRRTKLSMPNGATANYSYDSSGRLTDLTHKTSSGSTLASFTYTHDKVGNRLTKTETETKYSYSYDAIYRLLQSVPTKLQGKDKEQENKAETFSYDPVGNRLTGPRAKDYYDYNIGNQLTSDRKNQYEYDNSGNLVKKTEIGDDNKTLIWTYFYDFENRLIKVVKQEEGETKVITFKYDPFGRRIEKKVEGNDETKTYNYVYDNEDIILEYLSKTDGKVETTRYTHGLGIDEPLAVEQKGEMYYYHADGLGSIVALTDKKQKVVESYTYSSFGELKRQGDKVKNTFTFTAREWDEEINLYSYRPRSYDPTVGRFTTKDPAGFIDGTNLYVYAKSNPIRYADPFGLLSCDEVKKLVVANNLSGQSNEMIVCVCWKESSFNPNAQSSTSTARGLMQVTKAAAKDAGYDYNLLYDSATNIKAGSTYLKLRIQWTGGNITKGLEGYGTGSGYATDILSCEKCLKDNPCDCQKCLNLIH